MYDTLLVYTVRNNVYHIGLSVNTVVSLLTLGTSTVL